MIKRAQLKEEKFQTLQKKTFHANGFSAGDLVTSKQEMAYLNLKVHLTLPQYGNDTVYWLT